MAAPKVEFTEISKVKLGKEAVTNVDINEAAAETYRFLHIPSLLNEQTISIRSTTSIPEKQYVCISYVWRNLSKIPTDPTILVLGLKPDDDMSVPMLTIVCKVAATFNVEYIWLDKFGLKQTENQVGIDDRKWQMGVMYNIYNKCKSCIVAPGGLSRLPEITEKTTWIDRAWCLQEAIAPEDVQILFDWNKGTKSLNNVGACMVTQVLENVGMSTLRGILEMTLRGEVKVMPEEGGVDWNDAPTVKVGVFTGDAPPYSARALLCAMDMKGKDGRQNALWRCLIMRTARYKEDILLSSMGIMGVEVEPDGGPQGYDDKRMQQLLIQFVKALVAEGSRAEWLGIAPQFGPAKGFSALPPLPIDANLGSGYVKVKEGKYDVIIPKWDISNDGTWWWLKDAPEHPLIDDNGDILIKRKAVPIDQGEYYMLQKDTPETLVNCVMQPYWNIQADVKDPTSYAVYVGQKQYFNLGIDPMIFDQNSTLLMLVQKDNTTNDRYKNIGYAWADENIISTPGWEEKKFRIGG